VALVVVPLDDDAVKERLQCAMALWMPSCTCSSVSSRRCGAGVVEDGLEGAADRLLPSRLYACFSPAGTLARGARTPPTE
jgi:hypothetical protein